MVLTLLSTPGCPHRGVLIDRLHVVLGARIGQLDLVEVRDERHAAHWGMTGSPTLLVDGVDPFASPGLAPSVSCRLYPGAGAGGGAEGAPSIAALRAALLGGTPPRSG